MKLRDFIIPISIFSVYLFLYVPIIILILFSFNDAVGTYSWHGFTIDWYNQLFSSPEIWDALKNSLIVTSSSVILSLLMGTLLVWFLNERLHALFSLFMQQL